MTDATDGPEAGPSSPADTTRDAEPDADADSSSLGRREFLAGGGAIGTLALGGAGVYLSTTSSEEERSFLVQQGYLRWEIDPISDGDLNVEQFYDYQGTSADPEGDVIRDDAASRLFVYDGPVDASLVFLHGSPTVDHGGTALFSFSGLSRSNGEWAVRDDPMSISDDFEKWEGGNQQVKWEWGENTTDGGAYWGVLDRQDYTISIDPKTLRGVDSWRFLSGSLDDLRRIDLYREKPVKLKPANDRTVERANVDIMPESEANEFDPYSSETLTVAVTSPPAGVDESNWVDPDDLDPGNYAVNFGSKPYLAGQNAAQPQRWSRRDGALYLHYTAKSANFTLDSAYGYLVSKTGEKTYVQGRDVVRPGGFDNLDEEDAQLVVTDLHVDPEGEDARNLADEYVEFENDADEAFDLTGYTIRDESGRSFSLPDGFVLQPDERFRLHTGTGERTETDLYWGLDRPVWNNDGDTVVVLDDDRDAVLEYSYPRQ